jgi:hypothetical protein
MSPKKILILIASAAVMTAVLSYPLFAAAQTQQTPTVGVSLTAGTLSITHLPGSFAMTPVNIDSPAGNFFSYYINPATVYTSLSLQDGRFSGGFAMQVQVNSDYTSGSNIISRSLLGVRTQDSVVQENLMGDTPATTLPTESATDYTSFGGPILLLNGAVGCNNGRVGTYTVYPSFRLEVPTDTAAGTYTTDITYTLIDTPSDPC